MLYFIGSCSWHVIRLGTFYLFYFVFIWWSFAINGKSIFRDSHEIFQPLPFLCWKRFSGSLWWVKNAEAPKKCPLIRQKKKIDILSSILECAPCCGLLGDTQITWLNVFCVELYSTFPLFNSSTNFAFDLKKSQFKSFSYFSLETHFINVKKAMTNW